MGIPITNGQLRTSLADMQIGDIIPCRYTASTSGAVGTFSELGTCAMAEIPILGLATPNGLFYFIKVDKGLLIADRVVQHSIDWDKLNNGKYVEGNVINLATKDVLIRSLSGGCAYADANGNLSTTNLDFGGFPTTNEWDTYIVNNDLGGKITKADNNIWNWSGVYSMCKDTTITNLVHYINGTTLGDSTKRILRGYANANTVGFAVSTTGMGTGGFRPVLQYIEPDGSSKQTTLWY